VHAVAVVNVPGYEPWIVARWAMRMLMERASVHAQSRDDRDALVQALALDGLHLGLLPDVQARRVAAAVEAAADELRSELRGKSDPRDREFADRLGDLSLWLSDLTAT
jgi:hypothetical protein